MTSPFSDLPELPCDVAEALEQFKLAIIRHKSMDWGMISQDEMLDVCRALKEFVDWGPSKSDATPQSDSNASEFESYLQKYISQHPDSDVRFAAMMIRREYERTLVAGPATVQGK